MEILLRNRSPYLMLVTLNSGNTLHLAPTRASGPIDDIEINGNKKVDKLMKSGQISVSIVAPQHVERSGETQPEQASILPAEPQHVGNGGETQTE